MSHNTLDSVAFCVHKSFIKLFQKNTWKKIFMKNIRIFYMFEDMLVLLIIEHKMHLPYKLVTMSLKMLKVCAFQFNGMDGNASKSLQIPTGATLRSPFQIKDYLLSPGTCKCGLPCPLRPEYFFDFNVQGSP
uniref:MBD domain-containing protein n=1 Tax=Glossina austeni TaxID=7395 RepID=A0A1A9UJY8_GLOAU